MSRDESNRDGRDDTALGDRDRVFAEAPVSPIGGMWFTPDQSAPGGVRPLTETELHEATARVLATQGDAVDLDAVDRQIRESSQHIIDTDDEPPGAHFSYRTGEYLADDRDSDPADEVDARGDQR